MIHGDISNRESPILAFNMDNLLFKEEARDNGVIKRLLNKLSSREQKVLSRPTDSVFVSTLETLWNNYNYSIYLVTREDCVDKLSDKLSELNICYTRLVFISDLKDLRLMCHNRFTYYFDSDLSVLSYMSSKKAVHINNLWEKVK